MTSFALGRTASWRAALIATLLVALAGCYDSAYSTQPAPILTTLSLTLSDTIVEMGQPTRATAVLRDQYGSPFNGAVALFTSTNPEVAGVNPVDGRILAVAPGTTTITVMSGER